MAKDKAVDNVESKKELLPHQQRVVDEEVELEKKINGLEKFINGGEIFQTLNIEEQGDLVAQYNAMLEYAYRLKRRIGRF